VPDSSDFDPISESPPPQKSWEDIPEPPAVREVAVTDLPTPPQKKSSTSSFIWETLQTLVLAGLLIVFFRTFIFQNFVVEGSSMVPTLIQGDRLIVSRLSYFLGEPDRGDIIVFQYPYGPERDFVKRIIGLPGETIAIQNGQVFINGKPLPPEDYVQNKSSDAIAPVTLGDDEYFVMGDNRTGSSDSRSWGPMQKHFIIGKAWLIYYPFEHFQFLQHPDIEPEP
jgi:signal peptidase I